MPDSLAWAYAIERSSRESRETIDARFDALETKITEAGVEVARAVALAAIQIADACTVAILRTQGRLQ